MMILVLIGLLAVVGWRLPFSLFEFVFSCLLLAPLFWLLGAATFSWIGCGFAPASVVSYVLYTACLGLPALATFLAFGPRHTGRSYSDLYPLIAFAVFFSVARYMCGLWPDFMAMGERLRDYGILASVIQAPLTPQEPWMDGATLNYYVYWYRFGAMLSTLLRLEVWETYHTLASFAISFYAAAIFQVVRVLIGGSVLWAIVSSIAISFGSNYAGYRIWRRSEGGVFEHDEGWWGPSRVIQGAINEFPAWSFLLGDAHPHYLNLGSLPFLVVVLFTILSSGSSSLVKATQACALVAASVLFLAGSNAWEVPMWLGLVAVICFVYCVYHGESVLTSFHGFLRRYPPVSILRAIASGLVLIVGVGDAILSKIDVSIFARLFVVLSALGFAAVLCPGKRWLLSKLSSMRKWDVATIIGALFWSAVFLSLYLSSRHIVPEGGSLTLVRSPIPVTTTTELFVHWGFHLFVIVAALLLLLSAESLLALVVVGMLLALAVLYDKGALVLFTLVALQCLRILRDAAGASETKPWRVAFVEALLLAGLGLVLMPEIVFLDDPYGGENERMNTIFKIYTTAWGVLAVGGVGLLRRATSSYIESDSRMSYIPGVVFSCIFLSISLRFLYHSVPMRMTRPSEVYGSEGLAIPNSDHTGSGEAIRALRKLPRGRVLEAQGNAYSYTSFVSTLAGQPSYLGWSNHVNLLTKKYDEVGRREKITDQIYRETDCSTRRRLAQQEDIFYIVIGDLEVKSYPDIKAHDFSCFTKIMEQGEYAVYAQ